MTTNHIEQTTHQLQAVVAFSHEFAETHSLHHVTPEILLLGILQQENTLAVQTLQTLDIPIAKLRMKIVDSLPPVAPVRTDSIVLTPRSAQIIDLAFGEAKRQEQEHVGVEHLLWALIAEGSGFPARLFAKEGITLEKISRALGGFSEIGEIVQQEEVRRRIINVEMTEIWEELRGTELNRLPHIPQWLLYSVRAVFTFFFLLLLSTLFTNKSMSLWERICALALPSAITHGVWQIGIPRKTRQLAQKFQTWDNPAIIGSLCDMLTWSDNAVRKEARTGMTRLLPQIHTAALHQLYSSHGSLLSRMLIPTMAKRETEFVLAILGAFERIGAVKEKAVVRHLAETKDESPQMRRVQEAAQNCLATLELVEQQKTQKETLLRASVSTSTDNLLRAGIAPMETKPDELLRPVEE